MELTRDVPEGPRRSGAAALVLTALAGLAAGVLVVRLLAPHDAADAPDRAADGTADIVRELQALRAELTTLRAELVRPGALPEMVADAASREPQPLNDATAAALQSLAAALAELSARVPSLGAGTAVPLLVPPVQPEQGARLAKLLGQDAITRSQEHLLWTPQDVLDAYGRPDSIEVSGDVERWQFGSGPGQRIIIAFHEDRVFHLTQN
jgi:hypothetical protein